VTDVGIAHYGDRKYNSAAKKCIPDALFLSYQAKLLVVIGTNHSVAIVTCRLSLAVTTGGAYRALQVIKVFVDIVSNNKNRSVQIFSVRQLNKWIITLIDVVG